MTPSSEISISLTVKIHPDNLAKLEAWGHKYGITDRTELLERYIHKLATPIAQAPADELLIDDLAEALWELLHPQIRRWPESRYIELLNRARTRMAKLEPIRTRDQSMTAVFPNIR